MPRDTLTDRERKRLDRFEKMQQNRRGRSSPAVMPSKLARTAAFAPRKKNLVTDSNFKRVYEFRPHTVVEVSGRELGTQHRDALYALFKLRAKRTEEPNPLYNPNISAVGLKAPKPTLIYYHTITTWREILKATGRSAHVNNLGTVLRTFEEMRKVNFRVYTGTFDQYQAASKRGRLAGPGFSDNLLNEIEWSGVELDSPVRVRYGAWVKEMFETKTLVSVDSEVYFKLKSDYAKSLWPAIDSQNSYTWIDVEAVADLSGLDYAALTTRQKVKLREETRQAFEDMVAAGGLASWRSEQIGSGRVKTYRYHYVHALPRQGVLEMDMPADLVF
jgi:hypothetical protein